MDFFTRASSYRIQIQVWNECSRKLGWNERASGFPAKMKSESDLAAHSACTSFDVIELREGREPPAMRGESLRNIQHAFSASQP
jgi:hypothetical protein